MLIIRDARLWFGHNTDMDFRIYDMLLSQMQIHRRVISASMMMLKTRL